MVIDAQGLTREDIEGLWPHGFDRCDHLDIKHGGADRLGRYMTKNHEVADAITEGGRTLRFAYSKNLKKPVVRDNVRKVSRRRAGKIAADVQHDGRAIFEALYPGYQCMESPTVTYSDYVAGAWIYCKMRKIEEANNTCKNKRRPSNTPPPPRRS